MSSPPFSSQPRILSLWPSPRLYSRPAAKKYKSVEHAFTLHNLRKLAGPRIRGLRLVSFTDVVFFCAFFLFVSDTGLLVFRPRKKRLGSCWQMLMRSKPHCRWPLFTSCSSSSSSTCSFFSPHHPADLLRHGLGHPGGRGCKLFTRIFPVSPESKLKDEDKKQKKIGEPEVSPTREHAQPSAVFPLKKSHASFSPPVVS